MAECKWVASRRSDIGLMRVLVGVLNCITIKRVVDTSMLGVNRLVLPGTRGIYSVVFVFGGIGNLLIADQSRWLARLEKSQRQKIAGPSAYPKSSATIEGGLVPRSTITAWVSLS